MHGNCNCIKSSGIQFHVSPIWSHVIYVHTLSEIGSFTEMSTPDQQLSSPQDDQADTFTLTRSLLARRVGTVAMAIAVLLAGVLCKTFIILPYGG